MKSFAIFGLGKMGGNMARRLARGGVRPVLFDQDAALTAALAQEIGCTAGASPAHAILQLTSPCVVWLMLPSGAATEDMITRLAPLLRAGDVLVDGANSTYKDAIRRAASLKSVGVESWTPVSPAAFMAWPTVFCHARGQEGIWHRRGGRQ